MRAFVKYCFVDDANILCSTCYFHYICFPCWCCKWMWSYLYSSYLENFILLINLLGELQNEKLNTCFKDTFCFYLYLGLVEILSLDIIHNGIYSYLQNYLLIIAFYCTKYTHSLSLAPISFPMILNGLVGKIIVRASNKSQ
jgi:hypothetical protein